MLLGFVLLVIGIPMPFAMLLNLLESTLFLEILGYLASTAGLVLGAIGLIFYSRTVK